MAEIVNRIADAGEIGTVNIYAVRYNMGIRDDNFSVALPGNLDYELRRDFCASVIEYQDAREVAFNPLSDGLEDGTYEFIPLENVGDKWEKLHGLIVEALDYCGGENRKRVPFSNLYVCELTFENHEYFLCAKQGHSSDKLLSGKIALIQNQDGLRKAPSDVFLLSSHVGFLIDPYENKVLIFDKKAFQAVFRYDDYQRAMVEQRISTVEQWPFLASAEFIINRCSQKNVYHSLAKVFADPDYMEQIQRTEPALLKRNLLVGSPKNFSENDFDGDRLIVTTRNLATVMKMLSKGFKFNFFTNLAEQE